MTPTELRKQREREHRRKSILQAARKVFFKFGFQSASMEMIAQKAELAKGTLYLYFQSKEELYVSLLEEGLSILHGMIVKALSQDLDPEESILAMVESYYDFSVEHQEYFNILAGISSGAFAEEHKIDEATMTHIRGLEAQTMMPGIDILQKGCEQGIFPRSFVPAYTVVQIWVSITGAIMISKSIKNASPVIGSLDPRKFVIDIAQNFINSLKYMKERS